MARKSKHKWEFGDFQTPPELADQAMSILPRLGIKPKSIVEPTCGKGAFLLAASKRFPSAKKVIGVDINSDHLREAKASASRSGVRADFIRADFFSVDWTQLIDALTEPILVVGNPPWVTSSELATLNSRNLPAKSNFQKLSGFDAKTGKSNFDISESMLLKNLAWLRHKRGVIAVLCKTAVARKILSFAWKSNYGIKSAKVFRIDALKHFEASVDACFFVLDASSEGTSKDCDVYGDFASTKPSSVIGFHDNTILADVSLYQKWRHLRGTDAAYVWRSGIKHDCSKVMELEPVDDRYKNGLDEVFSLEPQYVYPMLKSSDIENGSKRTKCMLVTQQYTGEDTLSIRKAAPQTWQYLSNHADYLDRRGSSIYRNRPRFSIFGVGPYSFSPWKIAISGFYRDLNFKTIGPRNDKPVVFDDTVYFIPCWSEREARFISRLLCSEPAREFYRSMIFWPDKRPITAEPAEPAGGE